MSNFTEKVLTKIPNAIESEWHQHANGGGWVKNTAMVAGSAYIGADALVYGNAYISGNAQVYGDAKVYDNAHVGNNAQVYGDAKVHHNASVYGDAHVFGDAQVCGNASVFEHARVFGNAVICGYNKISGYAKTANVCGKTKEITSEHAIPVVIVDDNNRVVKVESGNVQFIKIETKEVRHEVKSG
jgi:carbonic anhydrase/acetyltransferase-like protein (isoleucine patch superfamily)